MASTAPLSSSSWPRHQRVLPALPTSFPEALSLQRDLRQPELINPHLGQAGAHAAADNASEVIVTLGSAGISLSADILPQPERQALSGDVGVHVAIPVLKVALGLGL